MTTANPITNERVLALVAAAEAEQDRLADWLKAEAEHLTIEDLSALRVRCATLNALRRQLHLDVAVYELPVNPADFWDLFDLLHNTPKEVTL